MGLVPILLRGTFLSNGLKSNSMNESLKALLNELDAAILSVDTDFDDNASVSVQFQAGQWQTIKRLVADSKREDAAVQGYSNSHYGLTPEQELNFRRLINDEIARYVGEQGSSADNVTPQNPEITAQPSESLEDNDVSHNGIDSLTDTVHSIRDEEPSDVAPESVTQSHPAAVNAGDISDSDKAAAVDVSQLSPTE